MPFLRTNVDRMDPTEAGHRSGQAGFAFSMRRFLSSTLTALTAFWAVANNLSTIFAAQQGVDRLGGGLLQRRRQVRVDLEGGADIAMTEPLTHNLGMHARHQHDRGRGVAQVVDADARHAGLITDAFKRHVDRFLCVRVCCIDS